ncbi:zinc transporter ZIP11 [Macrobrachium rosenbergii]|uniref:zinc transporter ZIP11 n=1 Tax=Macrobrachium rosenbergii TaxID=79674 RepID=UPI0034D63373
MIEGASPVLQALLGTLLTWGLTAAGSAVVFLLAGTQRKVLDSSLGFAAGVMTAASFWSLLAPAIEIAETSGSYGAEGEWACFPVAVGFLAGALFVYGADQVMGSTDFLSLSVAPSISSSKKNDDLRYDYHQSSSYNETYSSECYARPKFYIFLFTAPFKSTLTKRRESVDRISLEEDDGFLIDHKSRNKNMQWRRILLLIIAVTVHNIPEGLAVGVGFGAVGKTPLASFNKAKNLAIGIGIQNFPEGMAVSLPLRGAGHSLWWSFWYGQLSGMVEPIAGVLGAVAISICEPVLPYALAFAAGAMIFVVVDDIIPEAQAEGNGRLASAWCIVGFLIMMILDVSLG